MIINNQASLEEAITQLENDFEESKYLELDIKRKGKMRSGQQNRALHKYCDQMADKLNEGGIEYIDWLNHKKERGIQVLWTMELFKGVFKDYAGAMYPECKDKHGEPRTSKLTREQITKVYDLVNERMSVIFGEGLEWPSLDKEAWDSGA